jgi:hypothetical protein
MIIDFEKLTNRKVRVFISSTFLDMFPEREALVKRVFPKIRKDFKKRGIDIVEIDLRWGIPKKMVENEKVLETCLDEILKCRPFFLGILGNRYGWIPETFRKDPHSGAKIHLNQSMTEQEIRYGFLDGDANNTFASIHIKKIFDSQEDIRLKALKQEIIESGKCSVFEYSTICEFEKDVEFILKEHIDLVFPNEVDYPFGDIDYYDHLNLLKNHANGYVEHPKHIINLINDLFGGDTCLMGPSGAGKSATLSYVLKKVGHDMDKAVFFHYASANGKSMLLENLYSRLYKFVSYQMGLQVDENVNDYVVAITDLLPKMHEKLYAFIDAAELMQSSLGKKIGNPIDEIMSKLSSEKICFFFSSTLNPKTKNVNVVNINNLSISQKKKIVNNYMMKHGKKLDDEMIRSLLSNKLYDLPILMNVMTNEVRIYGNFQKLLETISLFSSINERTVLFKTVFERLRSDFRESKRSPKYVDIILQLMLLSHNGFSESEIMEISGMPPIYWAAFHSSISTFILEDNNRFSLNHQIIKEAVKIEYFSNPDSENRERNAREKIMKYFSKNPDASISYSEIAFQLSQMGRKLKLMRHIINKNSFDTLYDIDPDRLSGYFSSLSMYQNSIVRNVEKEIADAGEEEKISRIMKYGRKLLDGGCFSAVVKLLGKYVEKSEGMNKIVLLNLISRAHYKLGKCGFKKAISSYEYLLVEAQKMFPNDLSLINEIRFKYAVALKSSGHMRESFIHHKKATEYYIDNNMKNYNALWCVNNYADASSSTGATIDAKKLYDYSLSNSIDSFGENSLLVAWICCHMWSNDFHMGDFESALQKTEHAYKIHLETLGERSAEAAWSSMNLASMKAFIGNYRSAKELLITSIAINDGVLEPKQRPHSYSLTTRNNLGVIEYLNGSKTRAKDTFKAVLRWKEQKIGKEHSYYGNTLQNLAVCIEDTDPEQADVLYTTAIRIFAQEDMIPDFIFTSNNRCRLLLKIGKIDDAVKLRSDMLGILEPHEVPPILRDLMHETFLHIDRKESILKKGCTIRFAPSFSNQSELNLVSRI